MATIPASSPLRAIPVPPGSVERLIAEEHAEIRVHLGYLRRLALTFPRLNASTALVHGGAVLDFLRQGLLPHAAAEEATLYPAIDSLIGVDAARIMGLDHAVIADLADELTRAAGENLTTQDRTEAQRLLFVLEAFIRTHLWKEETVFAPLVAQLNPAAYAALHTSIVAHGCGHGHGH
ncbi:MAG: hemerythrin domain-containing protein [Thermoplasmata archaeon]